MILNNIVSFQNGKGHESLVDENGHYILINSKFISTDGEVKKYCEEHSKEYLEFLKETLENQKKELENKYGIPKDSLKERIKNIKKKVDEHLGNANKSVSDDMLEEIVESITVHKNYFEWKLNYLNDIIELNINSRQGKSTGNTLYVDEVELVTQTTSLHKLQSKLTKNSTWKRT